MKMQLVALLLLLTSSTISSSAKEKINFLFVIVDDLRPALGCYGDAKAHSPNIDRLAQRSILFDKAYAQQALCAPSRNSLLTSRRPDTLGLYDFYSYWRRDAGNFTSLPQHLKDNGYITASLGKVFHPGASSNHNDDSPYSWSEEPFHPSTERYKDAPVCRSKADSQPASNLVCPVRLSSMPNTTLPDIETLQEAKNFLNNKRKEPFFLAVGFQKPHIPLKYPRRYLKYHPLKKFSLPTNYMWPSNVNSVAYNPWTDLRRRSDIEKLGLKCPWEKIPKKYARKIIQSYYAAVTYIDHLIGELLMELEILGIRNNTAIILTSDHGWSLGEHAVWAKYSNFEVALRVPLIISIPKITFASSEVEKCLQDCNFIDTSKKERCCNNTKIVHDPVELVDIFPTIAELAELPIPLCPQRGSSNVQPDLCTEGSSLISLMEATCSRKFLPSKKFAISQYPRPNMKPTCKPSSDEPLLRDITIMGYSIRTIEYRYTAWVSFSSKSKKPNWQQILAEELYDHSSDYKENLNLADFKTFQPVKNELKNTLIKLYKKL